MNKAIKTAATAAAVFIGTTGALVGPAVAATPATTVPSPSTTTRSGGPALAAIQQLASTAISARISSLNAAISDVNANTVITSADKSTLLSTLNGDVSGLTVLGPKIQGDTSALQALADYRTIFTTYRVYALALPQVRFAEVADDLTGGVLTHLTDAQTKLAALLAGADSSKDTPSVQAAMSDLGNQITAITAATNGLSTSVLGLTPSQYDANPAILAGPRQSLTTARNDAKTARQDVATVLEALK